MTDPDVVVTLSAETPYGRLVRVASGDTTAVAGPLAWSEIERSEVLFVADSEWPEADATITVSGSLSDGASSTATLTLPAPGLRLDLDVDPAAYLPVKNETLTATVHLENIPSGLRSAVGFDLTQDYEFSYLEGTTGTRSVPLVGDSASVRLLSKTWWGVATLRVGSQQLLRPTRSQSKSRSLLIQTETRSLTHGNVTRPTGAP